MPKVKMVTPRACRKAAAGLGSPPLLYPSVTRNTAFLASLRARARTLCSREMGRDGRMVEGVEIKEERGKGWERRWERRWRERGRQG